MFRVIKAFQDLEDNEFIYNDNDLYPREENKKVDKERIDALSTTNNKRKEVLIELIDFRDMDIKSLVQYAKIYDIKFPKKSTQEEMISILENMSNTPDNE